MDTTETTTHLGLCAGYGGIELGLKRVIPNLRSVALCEIEAFAVANLVSKMEAGLMEPAPIWTDLKTFPWESFRDKVDILSGGYPCQPFSAAGKRLGGEDPRHLWPYIADGIRLLRPKLCFFENVEGHISLGLREVVGELEQIGYSTAWGIFSAAEVGAPHQRKRVFIMAYRDRERGQLSNWWRESAEQMPFSDGETRGNVWPSRPGQPQHAWEGCELADTDTRGQSLGINARSGSTQDCRGQSYTLKTSGVWPSRPGQPQYGWEPPRVVGNAESRQDNGRAPGDLGGEASQGGCGTCAADGASEGVGDTDNRRRGRSGDETSERQGHGSARASGSDEKLSQTEQSLGGNPDGSAGGMDYAELCVTCDNRTDELRLLGNGVVPATATLAFRTLLQEIISA